MTEMEHAATRTRQVLEELQILEETVGQVWTEVEALSDMLSIVSTPNDVQKDLKDVPVSSKGQDTVSPLAHRIAGTRGQIARLGNYIVRLRSLLEI